MNLLKLTPEEKAWKKAMNEVRIEGLNNNRGILENVNREFEKARKERAKFQPKSKL